VRSDDRVRERGQLHAAEAAFARILHFAIGDLDDDVRLRTIVDDAEAGLVAKRVLELADGRFASLQRFRRLWVA